MGALENRLDLISVIIPTYNEAGYQLGIPAESLARFYRRRRGLSTTITTGAVACGNQRTLL